MYQVDVTIEGASPGLLMHRFPEVTQAGLVNPVKLSGKKKDSPEAEAEYAAYRLEAKNGEPGGLCQPAEHIYAGLVKAAGDFQIQGKGKKTYRDIIKGLVLIDPELIPHNQMKYRIDARPARIQRARVIRHRPHLPEWALSFRMTCLEGDLLPVEVLNAILVKTGQAVGIGDYRPRFGRFVVSKFEAV